MWTGATVERGKTVTNFVFAVSSLLEFARRLVLTAHDVVRSQKVGRREFESLRSKAPQALVRFAHEDAVTDTRRPKDTIVRNWTWEKWAGANSNRGYGHPKAEGYQATPPARAIAYEPMPRRILTVAKRRALTDSPGPSVMDAQDEYIPEETFAACLNHAPQPCVDLVVEYDGGILLTRRRNEPAKGEWFWPGSRLYKGERLDDAAVRVAEEELGLDTVSAERLGVSEHFWEASAVDGVESRHTVPVVYRVTPDDSETVTLDEQHDEYRVVTAPPADANEYVVEYFERFDLGEGSGN